MSQSRISKIIDEFLHSKELHQVIESMQLLTGTRVHIALAGNGAEPSATVGQRNRIRACGIPVDVLFHDKSPHITEATAILQVILENAATVADLSEGVAETNNRFDHVLEIARKIPSMDQIDEIIPVALEHFRHAIFAGVVVMRPLNHDDTRRWRIGAGGKVNYDIVPPEVWESIEKELDFANSDFASEFTVPQVCRVLDQQDFQDSCSIVQQWLVEDCGKTSASGGPVFIMPIGASRQTFGLVAISTQKGLSSGSVEAQWLQVTLSTLSGGLAGIVLRETEAARQRDATSRKVLEKATAVVAHKLKSPIAFLLENARFIAHDFGDSPVAEKVGRRIERMEGLSQRIHEVISEFNKLPVTKSRPEPTDLPGLVNNILQLALGGSDYQACVATPSDPFPSELMLDPGLVRSIVEELVANSLQASAKRIAIRLTGPHAARNEPGNEMKTSYIEMTIADDGSGIDARVQQEMFHSFRTTKVNGTGLGLAIVEKYVSLMGGRVFEDGPDEELGGARFRITLPFDTKMK